MGIVSRRDCGCIGRMGVVDSSHFPLSVQRFVNFGIAVSLYWITFICGHIALILYLLISSACRYGSRRRSSICRDASIVWRRAVVLISSSCGGKVRFWSRWLWVCSLKFVESVVHCDAVSNHLVVVRGWALHLVDERCKLVRVSSLKAMEERERERDEWNNKNFIP